MNKIKQNIKSLAVCTFLGTALAGCIDMDVMPPSAIGAETFWKTEKDAWLSLNACYYYMPGSDIFHDCYVDNAFNHHAHESKGQATQSASVNADNTVGYGYEDIRRFNTFIKNVDNCEMDADLKERMKAEVRFMRAYSYVNMNLIFGKVSIITDALEYNAPNVARDSEEKVRKFIMDELNEIINILPPNYSGGYLNEKGRITKWAALAVKSKASLCWGDYATAEAAAKEIMRDGGFSLFKIAALNENQQKEADEMDAYVDFASLGIDKDEFMKGMFSYEAVWHTENGNPDNPEYILTTQFMPGDPDYGDFMRYSQMRPDQMKGGWGSVEPIQSLVDAYWDASGETQPTAPSAEERASRYNEIRKDADEWLKANAGKAFTDFVASIQGDKLKNYGYTQEFRNRDSRLYASILFPFKGWYETDMGPDFAFEWKFSNNDPKGGYTFRKITPLSSNTIIWGTNYVAEGDYPVIRYAEILLNFAEARLMGTGWDIQVENALNELRDRCGMPHVPSFTDKNEAIDFIRNERRIELAGEGNRYYDIRRYGNEYAAEHMNYTLHSINNNWHFEMEWDDKLMLMPISQGAMDLNPLLRDDQNPGY